MPTSMNAFAWEWFSVFFHSNRIPFHGEWSWLENFNCFFVEIVIRILWKEKGEHDEILFILIYCTNEHSTYVLFMLTFKWKYQAQHTIETFLCMSCNKCQKSECQWIVNVWLESNEYTKFNYIFSAKKKETKNWTDPSRTAKVAWWYAN